MIKLENNLKAFFVLIQAGLWETEVRLMNYEKIDINEVYRIAEEQSVIGLVAAGLDGVIDVKVPQEIALTFVGSALQLEQRNVAMNLFVENLIDLLRKAGIYAVLVKGQGIAQCYARPLWRSSGDVDLLLSEENYQKAVKFLKPKATTVDEEKPCIRHLALTIDNWPVELHGTLRSGLWRSVEKAIDKSQEEVFFNGEVRSWMNGRSQVFLPSADVDVFLIFTHILQHLFREGIGLRQICDWCRLLWTYRDVLNRDYIKSRLDEAGIMTEWKAFAALAVDYLGMPEDAMPFYDKSLRWKRKGKKVLSFILETGNFGHNRDYSYQNKCPYLVFKTISLWRHIKDLFKYFGMFPLDSIKFCWVMIRTGVSLVVKRK